MQPGINKSIGFFDDKLLISMLACMIYRIITISISLIYTHFFVPHKIHISINLYGFYLYLFLVCGIIISAVIPRRAIGVTVAAGSTLLLGMDIFRADLPYRALLFVFSAFWAYLFVFTSNSQLRKVQSESLKSKAVRRLKYILLIVYPIYIFFEKDTFRNVSLFITCLIFLVFFISWLNRKLQ
jgi:hypothetical protein